MRRLLASIGYLLAATAPAAAESDFEHAVQPLLKARCVRCHGPVKPKGGLDLSTAGGLARGGDSGAVITPKDPEKSLLWRRVAAGEMPPKQPLADTEKAALRQWIAAGAPGLGKPTASEHWAFARLRSAPPPAVKDAGRVRTVVDRYLQATLEAKGLTLGPEADRRTLIRRVAFVLTGLPPAPEEIDAFLADAAPGAYERMVERYLASPRHGEHWGKHWLDALGYADTNGYFGRESERPHAWRYRDWVVRAVNADKPLDRFFFEQLAGDELAGVTPGGPVTQEQKELILATHLLRNGPDGTDDSAPSPEAKRIDRYAALEAVQQVVYTGLLALSIKCARCHDHKFEPITQREYYQTQSIFFPAFNPENWVIPAQRVVKAATAEETAAWESRQREVTAKLAAARREFKEWVRQNRPAGRELYRDEFEAAPAWAAAPAGAPPGRTESGRLVVAASVDSWLATPRPVEWVPAEVGAAVQVTFDLLADRAAPGDTPCQYYGFTLAATDFGGSAPGKGGNLFFDGRHDGGARVYRLRPGANRYEHIGAVGAAPYAPGRNFGVRVTNLGGGKVRLEHLVDFAVDGKPMELAAADLPPGPFAFYRYPGRNYAVGNLVIESVDARGQIAGAAPGYAARLAEFTARLRELEKQRTEAPGETVAWVTDMAPQPPRVFLLRRGLYGEHGEEVQPAGLAALTDADNKFTVTPPAHGRTTGRRLALANWLLKPGSRPAALVARVQANRIWQHHFGTGLVATPDNFGLSGARPSHPELLEFLAAELVRTGWSAKELHRLILTSAAFRQASAPDAKALAADPDDRFLWRYPLRRLDAEEVRDAMLAASGELDRRMGGAPVPLDGVDGHGSKGEVMVREAGDGALRRTVYVQRRRNVLPTFLQLFDFPAVTANCTDRPSSTVALQSLAQLNSGFARRRAAALADRLTREAPDNAARVDRAFVLCTGRPPSDDERADALAFLVGQRKEYGAAADAPRRALVDFCQMVFASNLFLYVE